MYPKSKNLLNQFPAQKKTGKSTQDHPSQSLLSKGNLLTKGKNILGGIGPAFQFIQTEHFHQCMLVIVLKISLYSRKILTQALKGHYQRSYRHDGNVNTRD